MFHSMSAWMHEIVPKEPGIKATQDAAAKTFHLGQPPKGALYFLRFAFGRRSFFCFFLGLVFS